MQSRDNTGITVSQELNSSPPKIDSPDYRIVRSRLPHLTDGPVTPPVAQLSGPDFFGEPVRAMIRNSEMQSRRLSNVRNETYFPLDPSDVCDFGRGSKFSLSVDGAIGEHGDRSDPDAGHSHPASKYSHTAGQHYDSQHAQLGTAVYSSRSEFYQPANSSQRHEAFHGRSKHESRADSAGFTMWKVAGYAGFARRVNTQSRFLFDSGKFRQFNCTGNIALGHALSARDFD